MFTYKEFIESMNEGLILTHDVETAERLISKWLIYRGYKLTLGVDKHTQTLYIGGSSRQILNKDIKDIIDRILFHGYFPSLFHFYKGKKETTFKYRDNPTIEYFLELNTMISKSTYFQINCEAKYNKEVKYDGPLYHLTDSKNIDSIMSSGLYPKNKSKLAYHNSRVYFAFTKENAINLASQFKDSNEFILLQVDSKGLKLYDDPDFYKSGCWTYDSITPANIKVIKRFKN